MNLLGNHSTEIISVLENSLIKPEEGLHIQYELLEVYGANNVIPKTGFLSKHLLNLEYSKLPQVQDGCNLAIDLPIYLVNKSSKVNVMICAMDPLSYHCEKGKIGIWNPFSILRNPEKHKGSDASNYAFFNTLKNNFNLYITDVYKLYFMYEGKKSNKISDYKKLKVHKAILEQEIKIIKPEFILTLGKPSKAALLNIFSSDLVSLIPTSIEGVEVYEVKNPDLKIICLPHISGASNGAKSKLLDGKSIEGHYINEKLAYLLMIILKKLIK